MLFFRLLLIFLVIASFIFLGLYLFLDDKKYLQYFKKILKYTLFLVIAWAVIAVVRRIFYV